MRFGKSCKGRDSKQEEHTRILLLFPDLSVFLCQARPELQNLRKISAGYL